MNVRHRIERLEALPALQSRPDPVNDLVVRALVTQSPEDLKMLASLLSESERGNKRPLTENETQIVSRCEAALELASQRAGFLSFIAFRTACRRGRPNAESRSQKRPDQASSRANSLKYATNV